MYEMFFRNRVLQLRKQKGVSAMTMSIAIGQSESYINKIENGKCFPSIKALFSICEYFCITPQDFFDITVYNTSDLDEFIKDIKKLDSQKFNNIASIVKYMVNQ